MKIFCDLDLVLVKKDISLVKFLPSKKRIQYLCVFVAAIIMTIAAGWFFTDYLGRVAEQEFKADIDKDANLTTFLLRNCLENAENTAKALGPSEAIVAALSSGSPADLERANRLLDCTNSSLKMSGCYLLDRNGLTVASSNRTEENGFTGKSFATRSYVKRALAGRVTTYFALDKITNERGYYAAAPVVDSDGKIIGVIVARRNVAPVGKFFEKYTHAFLVSPEGIIFIASRKELLFRSLWPVDEKRRHELLASGQFGSLIFEPPLAAEPQTGTYVRFDNSDHYVQRLPFGSDGWTLVIIERPVMVSNNRLFGILLSIVFGLMLLFFIVMLRHKEKSLAVAKDLLKAKDDWECTFDAVPDLIAIIDNDYCILHMNSSMADRLGISKEEAVGRHCYELVHGSLVPNPSCPLRRMFDSGRSESEFLFEKNLNGYFILTAAPILAEDGKTESSVYLMHDVSDLKRMEQSLREFAQRLELALEGSNDATWEWNIIEDQGFLNMRYYEMMEITPGEVDINFAFYMKTIHPEDFPEVEKQMTEHLEGKTSKYVAQYRMVTKSGQIKHVVGRGKIIMRDEDGRPLRVAGVVTDVTEMKRLREEVNRINNLESTGLLAGGLSHDFNNILNIICGNLTIVKMLAEGNTAIVEPITDAEEACERAKEFGIRLQSFSKNSSPVKAPVFASFAAREYSGGLET